MGNKQSNAVELTTMKDTSQGKVSTGTSLFGAFAPRQMTFGFVLILIFLIFYLIMNSIVLSKFSKLKKDKETANTQMFKMLLISNIGISSVMIVIFMISIYFSFRKQNFGLPFIILLLILMGVFGIIVYMNMVWTDILVDGAKGGEIAFISRYLFITPLILLFIIMTLIYIWIFRKVKYSASNEDIKEKAKKYDDMIFRKQDEERREFELQKQIKAEEQRLREIEKHRDIQQTEISRLKKRASKDNVTEDKVINKNQSPEIDTDSIDFSKFLKNRRY